VPLTIGLDFGTSNTSAAVLRDGRPEVLQLEPGQAVLPTAIFLDYAARTTLYGSDAVAAMIEGRRGRFMRALKSILGTPLARERRTFLNERLTLLEIIARFLAEVRARAGAAIGDEVTGVVAGRPVHFHPNAARDARAEQDLAECYAMAGFTGLRFLPEPEAAALAAGPGPAGEVGLIVDIGGGTSDFTLFRAAAQGGIDVLASHGVRIGGTDFDRALSLQHVMPLFGLGGELRNEIGPGRHDVPRAMFVELASWEKIAFIYGPDSLRAAKLMARQAVTPERLGRLVTVLEMEQGHEVAFAVEAAKIAANGGTGVGRIDLGMVERGLAPVLTGDDLMTGLWPFAEKIGEAVGVTLSRAGLPPAAVGRVIFVGGSSLVTVIDRLLRATFPAARFETAEVFTAVVDGLALATAER